MKYYLDFDYTLFDTAKFRQELFKILENNGLDKTYLGLTPELKNQGQELLNLRKLFKHLSATKKIPYENFINPLEEVFSRCDQFLYSDSVEFLKFLKANGNEVRLLTWGDAEFQQEKVEASKIDAYFDEIIYTEKLKYTLDNVDYEHGIFIDDSPRDLEGLKSQNAIEVIRVKREGAKNSSKDLPETLNEIKEVKTLKELQKIIENSSM